MSESIKITATILDDEYVGLQKVVRGFANEVVNPVSAEYDHSHTFPYEIVSQMGEMGPFGLPFPKEVGGMGGDYLSPGVALKELAKIDQSVAITLKVGAGSGAMPAFYFGNEGRRETYLPELTAGKRLASLDLTRPGVGSDAGATRTAARGDGDDFIVNGAEQFITNSGTDIISPVTIIAVTGQKESNKKEIFIITIPSDAEGLVAEPAYDEVGWNAPDIHPLTSADIRIPQGDLLDTRGRDFANFLSILAGGHVAIAVFAIGAAQGCIDESVRHIKERHSMGRAISEYQVVSFKVTRMEARAHATRMAWYDAAAKIVAGTNFRYETYIAKIIASEVTMGNACDTTRIFGGYGFMNEYRMARHYRDSRTLEIDEDITEMQLVLIARGLGL